MLLKILPGLAAVLLATSAMAEGRSPQDPASDTPVASARSKALDDQIAAYLNASPDALPAPRSEFEAPLAQPSAPDRAVHGEAGFGIGTNGYREAYAVMVAPVGKSGTAMVAVSDVQGRGRFGPRSRQSLSLGLALGESAASTDPSASCAAREGGRFEPLWASRLRAERPGLDLACPTRALPR